MSDRNPNLTEDEENALRLVWCLFDRKRLNNISARAWYFVASDMRTYSMRIAEVVAPEVTDE